MNPMLLADTVTNKGMAEFLTDIGTFFTQNLTWASEVFTKITETPALTVLCLAMPISGFVLGWLARLIRTS